MRFHTFPKVQASSPAGPMLASSRIGLVLVPLLVSSLLNGVIVISPYLRAGLRAYMSPSPFSARLWGGNSCRPLLRARNGTPNGHVGSPYYPHVFYWDCVWALPFPSWEGVHSPRSLHPPRCPISLRPGERQYRTGPSSSIRSRDVTPGHIGVLCDGVSPTSRSSSTASPRLLARRGSYYCPRPIRGVLGSLPRGRPLKES